MAKESNISNFIKYSDKVFLLNEKDSIISHDIPFQNQYSGKIKLKITAHSPIFIRNNYQNGDNCYEVEKDGKNINISEDFCHFNNVQYIPASSFKGMLRNTMEIMTYGKLKGKTPDVTLNKKIEDNDSLHKSEKLDLSEAIFGTTEIKGRIFISHFKIKNEAKVSGLKEEILATPEEKEDKFGWKNYPIIDNLTTGKSGNNEKVKSKFRPLNKNTVFEGDLKFHNLRDFELGAILSALTFHDTPNCFHNIGLAKSLGYGKISISFKYEKKLEVLQIFEEKLNVEIFNGKIEWHESEYLEELIEKHNLQQNIKIKSLSSQQNVKNMHGKNMKIKEDEDFNLLKDSDDIKKLKNYTKEYPNSKNNSFFQKKIDEIEEEQKLQEEMSSAYKSAIGFNCIEIYNEFSKNYPSSKYIQDVRDRVEKLNDEKEKIKKQDEATKKAVEKRKNVFTMSNVNSLRKKKR